MPTTLSTMPWGPFKGRTIRPSQKEPGHWMVVSSFGWHDCSPLEDEKINTARAATADPS